MPRRDIEYGLRVGGWIPPYFPRKVVHQDNQSNRRPPQRADSSYPVFTTAVTTDARLPRRALVLAATVVALGSLAIGVLIAGLRSGPTRTGAQESAISSVFAPYPPVFTSSTPVAMQPAPTISAAQSPAGRPASSTQAGGNQVPRVPGQTPAATAHPIPELRSGATIGLETVDRPGYRIRHQNFLGRVDAIGPRSSNLDHSDSRFVVHAGFVADGCFAFESVNYPGYYLRHRDFVIHLDRADGTRIFAKDATFCPSPAGPGGSLVLQSANYRSRYINVRSDRLFLDELAPGQATAFRVRPPL